MESWRVWDYLLGVDLGSTKSWVVWDRGKISLATAVSYKKKDKEVIAVGDEAEEMWYKVPSQLEVVKPVQRGRVVNDEAVGVLVNFGLDRVGVRSWYGGLGYFLMKVVVVVDPSLNSVEKRIITEVINKMGFKRVCLVDKVLVGLVGHDWDVMEADGRMSIYIGGMITHVSLVSLGGKVIEKTIPKGGYDINWHLINYVRQRYDVEVGFGEMEKVKRMIGSGRVKVRLRGLDKIKQKARVLELSMEEVSEVVLGGYSQVIREAKQVLNKMPSEFLPTVNKQGVILFGGGSWVGGLDVLLAKELGVPVRCEKGKDMVARGLERVVKREVELEKLKVSYE